ncbi:MAG: GntR family transcriptional regulator [Anaerolineae bacterium]
MLNKQIKPIEDMNKTVSSMAQERIRDAILEGILRPGTRIDQNQLAKDLNTSLVPVREALKKLEGEGFVQIIPRRGAFITETSTKDMEDLYFARSILEGQAGYHAAPNLTQSDLDRLDSIHDQVGTSLKTHDFAAFTHLNREFHFTIYDAAGSKYLAGMIASLWDLAERYRYRYVFFKDQGSVIQAEHKQILDACHAHDSRALREAIIFHMNQTLNGIRSFVEHNTLK